MTHEELLDWLVAHTYVKTADREVHRTTTFGRTWWTHCADQDSTGFGRFRSELAVGLPHAGAPDYLVLRWSSEAAIAWRLDAEPYTPLKVRTPDEVVAALITLAITGEDPSVVAP